MNISWYTTQEKFEKKLSSSVFLKITWHHIIHGVFTAVSLLFGDCPSVVTDFSVIVLDAEGSAIEPGEVPIENSGWDKFELLFVGMWAMTSWPVVICCLFRGWKSYPIGILIKPWRKVSMNQSEWWNVIRGVERCSCHFFWKFIPLTTNQLTSKPLKNGGLTSDDLQNSKRWLKKNWKKLALPIGNTT